MHACPHGKAYSERGGGGGSGAGVVPGCAEAGAKIGARQLLQGRGWVAPTTACTTGK